MKLTGQISGNEVYWRLYKSTRSAGLMTVVCMQWFDELVYSPQNFVRNESGDVYYFLNEEDAIKYLNEWYEPYQIDLEYRNSNKVTLIR
jgi:hypothetical protein